MLPSGGPCSLNSPDGEFCSRPELLHMQSPPAALRHRAHSLVPEIDRPAGHEDDDKGGDGQCRPSACCSPVRAYQRAAPLADAALADTALFADAAPLPEGVIHPDDDRGLDQEDGKARCSGRLTPAGS